MAPRVEAIAVAANTTTVAYLVQQCLEPAVVSTVP
jgi:hypothetical protein